MVPNKALSLSSWRLRSGFEYRGHSSVHHLLYFVNVIKTTTTSPSEPGGEAAAGRLGLRSGFEPPDLDRPGRQPHQQGPCEARLGCQDESPQLDSGLMTGFEAPDLDRPGRLPHQQGPCEARLGQLGTHWLSFITHSGLGLRSGFEPSGLDRPGRLPHQLRT